MLLSCRSESRLGLVRSQSLCDDRRESLKHEITKGTLSMRCKASAPSQLIQNERDEIIGCKVRCQALRNSERTVYRGLGPLPPRSFDRVTNLLRANRFLT